MKLSILRTWTMSLQFSRLLLPAHLSLVGSATRTAGHVYFMKVILQTCHKSTLLHLASGVRDARDKP